MESIWNIEVKRYDKLKQNKKTQVAVIGGGIAGFLTAFQLSKKGYEVTLLEANKLFCSTTLHTTAFITSLQGINYNTIKRKYGFKKANLFFYSQEEAIKEYEKLVKEYNIECSFQVLPTYLFTRSSNKKLIKEYDILRKIGANVNYRTKLDAIHTKVNGAIYLNNQATFQPIQFLRGLPTSFSIYEQTRVTKIDFKRSLLYANDCKIEYEHLVVATHFPIFDVPKLIFTKMYQSTSYAAAYSNAPNVDGLYVEDKKDGITIRNYKNYLIIGGEDHRTGRLYREKHFEVIDQFSRRFENLTLKYKWLAEDCMTFDGVPLVGNISKKYPNCYVITGFNKWGMANAMTSSKLICDLITKTPNEYRDLFSLSRKYVFKSLGKFLINSLVTFINLFKSFVLVPFRGGNSLQKEEGAVVLMSGKKVGVYKDEKGMLYKVNPRCSHLKCELAFNKTTKTFDCPCHGSRFDIYGNIITEPAKKPIHLKKD